MLSQVRVVSRINAADIDLERWADQVAAQKQCRDRRGEITLRNPKLSG
jgi:hypothetical protein